MNSITSAKNTITSSFFILKLTKELFLCVHELITVNNFLNKFNDNKHIFITSLASPACLLQKLK